MTGALSVAHRDAAAAAGRETLVADALAQFFTTDDLDGWDVLFAALTLLGTWLATRYARRAARVATARIKGLTTQVQDLVVGMVSYLVLLAGIGLALTFLGAQTQPILTVVVVVGIVVVLTMRGLADNFGAGILLQTRMRCAARCWCATGTVRWTGRRRRRRSSPRSAERSGPAPPPGPSTRRRRGARSAASRCRPSESARPGSPPVRVAAGVLLETFGS